MATNVLSMHGIHRSYRTGPEVLHVLADLRLDVEQGEWVAILGTSGSGKSTLMNALSGAGVHTEDLLFATLDATTRKLELDGGVQVVEDGVESEGEGPPVTTLTGVMQKATGTEPFNPPEKLAALYQAKNFGPFSIQTG